MVRGFRTAYPSLFRSMMPGAKWWTYALVQMSSRRTRRSDWKLKRADYRSLSELEVSSRTTTGIPSWQSNGEIGQLRIYRSRSRSCSCSCSSYVADSLSSRKSRRRARRYRSSTWQPSTTGKVCLGVKIRRAGTCKGVTSSNPTGTCGPHQPG